MAEIKIKWYPARSCWRKAISVDGKEVVKYYQYPNNAKGKEKAIAEYLKDKEEPTGMTFEEKVKPYLPLVLEYHQKFPAIGRDVVYFVQHMLKTMTLPDPKFHDTDWKEFAVNWGNASLDIATRLPIFAERLEAKF